VSRSRGFAITELLVALVIAGIIGVALTRLVINQSRFVSLQDGLMRARAGARAALNVLADDLRTIGDSGLVAVAPDSVTVRVPYATGIVCRSWAGRIYVSILPSDATRYSTASLGGYMWRDSLARWHPVENVSMTTGAALFAVCLLSTPVVQVLPAPNWPRTAVGLSPYPAAMRTGTPVHLFERVTYRFGPSMEMPGRRALWRAVPSAGRNDELVVPFDTAARFLPLVGRRLIAQALAPATLDSVFGVRVRLVAASDARPAGRSAPVTFDLTTDFLFRNHAP
jgi:prepilin-type N-terminal cleavage/methylation domain-containing protein